MREDAYSVDADDLGAVIQDLARSHRFLAELDVDLERQVRDLHDAWNGRAADAHQVAQTAWAQSFGDMREALARMRTAADVAHTNYTAAATTNQQMWEQVR